MSARRVAGAAVVLGLALPLAVLLQLAVASDLSLVAGAPDLVLIVVCAPGACTRARAWRVAASPGLGLDVLAEHALGRDALIFSSPATASGSPASGCARPRPFAACC